jgi:hypothetical protein
MKDGQTIGQWLKWDFEANGDLVIKDQNGKPIYWESLNSGWAKREHDDRGNQLYYEDSNGFIFDNRTPEIIEHNGRKYQLIP